MSPIRARFRPSHAAAVLALVLGVAIAAPQAARAQSEEQQLVTQAQWTLEKMLKQKDFSHLRKTLPKAQGVLIFPSILKGAFIFGAEGGTGVLLAKTKPGDWSYPAFFTLGAGSFGLQIGGEDKEVVFLLMSAKAVNAVIASEVKLGGDLSVSAGPVGMGLEGSTTTAVGADMIAYSLSQGAFAGISFEGAVVHERTRLNGDYYQGGATARQIVQQRKFRNPGSDPLRGVLAKY